MAILVHVLVWLSLKVFIKFGKSFLTVIHPNSGYRSKACQRLKRSPTPNTSGYFSLTTRIGHYGRRLPRRLLLIPKPEMLRRLAMTNEGFISHPAPTVIHPNSGYFSSTTRIGHFGRRLPRRLLLIAKPETLRRLAMTSVVLGGKPPTNVIARPCKGPWRSPSHTNHQAHPRPNTQWTSLLATLQARLRRPPASKLIIDGQLCTQYQSTWLSRLNDRLAILSTVLTSIFNTLYQEAYYAALSYLWPAPAVA